MPDECAHPTFPTNSQTNTRTAIPDGAAAASGKGAAAPGGEEAPPAQTRAELEKEIKAATAAMDAAMKAKAFDKCAEIQATLDTLEAARAKLPTAAELDKKVRESVYCVVLERASGV